MRYQAGHKERSHQAILNAAVRILLLNGPENLAIADVMSEAGLTHGAFYAHFASKDDLLAEGVRHAFARRIQAATQMKGADSDIAPRDALRSYVAGYLSRSHRDNPATGCPLPALSSAVSRMSLSARTAYELGFRGIEHFVLSLMQSAGIANPEAAARSGIIEMMGTQILARAISDNTASDAILRVARASLLQRLGLDS